MMIWHLRSQGRRVKATLIEFLVRSDPLTVAGPEEYRVKLKMPYGSARNLGSCFPICHPCLDAILASLDITSSVLQSIHYLYFIQKSLGHPLELFSWMSSEMAPPGVWDVLTPLCWVPPPTGTVWSSLLFCLHPAKHSAALHIIQKPIYSQKNNVQIFPLQLFYSKQIQKPNIFSFKK